MTTSYFDLVTWGPSAPYKPLPAEALIPSAPQATAAATAAGRDGGRGVTTWMIPPVPPAAELKPPELGPPNRCEDCTLRHGRYCAATGITLPECRPGTEDVKLKDTCLNYQQKA